jgi:hypothetical protein
MVRLLQLNNPVLQFLSLIVHRFDQLCEPIHKNGCGKVKTTIGLLECQLVSIGPTDEWTRVISLDHKDTRDHIYLPLFYIVHVFACNLRQVLVDTLYRLLKAVLRIRIRKDPHHLAGSGSHPKFVMPDMDPADPDPDLRPQNWHLIKVFSVEKYCE